MSLVLCRYQNNSLSETVILAPAGKKIINNPQFHYKIINSESTGVYSTYVPILPFLTYTCIHYTADNTYYIKPT